MSLDELQLENLILRIGEGAHGNAGILELKNALKKAKPNEIISFWQKHGIREPITWDAVKERLWKTPEEQEKNRFPFLQGDIILTSGVSRLAQSRSTMTHSIWLVCTPSCDIVRRRFIRVAPLHTVMLDYRDKTSPHHQMYLSFKTALFFSTYQRFALPPMKSDSQNVLGYFAEFEEPFFLEEEFKYGAVSRASLSLLGWHLLNAALQQLETRANMQEELQLRS